MKTFLNLFILSFFTMILTPANAVKSTIAPQKEVIENNAPESAKEWDSLSKKEKRAVKKTTRKKLKSLLKSKKSRLDDTDLLLLVLIGIFIPPLAMGLYDGISKRFWISLLLTLLLFIPGMIYTLIVIIGEH